jgi:acyl-CoA thioesterase FadM
MNGQGLLARGAEVNHLFRLFGLILTAPWRKRLTSEDHVCITHFRCWFTDLDVLMHMNNGIYLSLMDLGRVDLMLRMGALHKLRKKGIYPVVVSEAIRFRRSLKLFQKFRIVTETAGWDDKYVFLTQKFYARDEMYASAIIKGRFLHKNGSKISPDELWKAAEITPKILNPMPASHLLQALEAELHD